MTVMMMTQENLQIFHETKLPTAEDTKFKFPNTDTRTAAIECQSRYAVVAELLARSQYPEGPATGHLGTSFSWFPCV
jgi:hypothetical protein